MRPELGSRSRFIFRMVLYSLAPLVGLFVLLNSGAQPEGLILGFIGISIGLVAMYQLYSRLKNPRVAARYALKPHKTVEDAISSYLESLSPSPSVEELMYDLQGHLGNILPDVQIEDIRSSPSEAPVYAIGDEIILFAIESPNSFAILHEVLEHAVSYQTPLQNERLFLIFAGELKDGMTSEILESFPTTKIFNVA